MHAHGMQELPTFGSLVSEIFLGIEWIPSSAPQHLYWGKLSCVLAALSSWVQLPTLCEDSEQDRRPIPSSLQLPFCLLTPLLCETHSAFSFQLSKEMGTFIEHILDSDVGPSSPALTDPHSPCQEGKHVTFSLQRNTCGPLRHRYLGRVSRMLSCVSKSELWPVLSGLVVLTAHITAYGLQL